MYHNIFDSHSHYTSSRFEKDAELLISSLHDDAGVCGIMLASCSIPDSCDSLKLSRKFEYVYSSAGIHPELADSAPANYISQLESVISGNTDKIKAVGEIGLDYHYENFDRSKQKELFAAQIELAEKLNLPVIVHSREATADCLDILKAYRPKGVVHCFSGSAETALEILKLDMYIGFTGVLTFKNARKAVSALEVIPTERLLLETDCPYMSPVPHRGERCTSGMIKYIAEKAAEIKNIDTQSLLDITCGNACRLFNISL